MHIMEEDQVNLPIPTCTNVPVDIAESSTIIEEGPRICPLCNSIVKLFFINLNDKILMCENTECEFPFGHEELQFAKVMNEFPSNEEVTSIQSCRSSIATASVVSATEWSEIEKMNRAYDSEDTQSEIRSYSTSHTFKCKENAEQMRNKKRDEQIKQNVKSIKGYNKVIRNNQEDEEDVLAIRNEKWIKELLDMQKSSGLPLVSKQELNKLMKKDPRIGLGELKIDIDNESPISSIKIEITNNKNS